MGFIALVLFCLIACYSNSFSVDATGNTSSCDVSAEMSDHLIVEYMFWQDGEELAGLGRRAPNQLQYIHLEENVGTLLQNLLVGMCVGQTRRATYTEIPVGTGGFSPIPHPRLEKGEEVDVEMTLVHVTSQWDFDIFAPLSTGNVSQLLTFIETHRGINAVDERGQTTLMVATQSGSMQVIAGLLNTRRPRVDVNMAKSSGHTAVHYAVGLKSTDTLRALLRRGADPNALIQSPGAIGNTALHLACFLEKPKHARILLEFGASTALVNEHGQSAKDMIPRQATPSTKLDFRAIFYEHSNSIGASDEGSRVHTDAEGAYWRDL